MACPFSYYLYPAFNGRWPKLRRSVWQTYYASLSSGCEENRRQGKDVWQAPSTVGQRSARRIKPKGRSLRNRRSGRSVVLGSLQVRLPSGIFGRVTFVASQQNFRRFSTVRISLSSSLGQYQQVSPEKRIVAGCLQNDKGLFAKSCVSCPDLDLCTCCQRHGTSIW